MGPKPLWKRAAALLAAKYDNYGGCYKRIPIPDFGTTKYLTREIIEWLETHMILPEIAEDGAR